MENATTTAPSKAMTNQPRASTEMKVMSVAEGAVGKQAHCEHQHKASRLRGGSAGKDCFLGLVGCFLCFECCEGCCECVGDILCCPCEMCC
ncbi:uncharacterized protein LACBIDRAFT_293010 [Laccaria bicolor S238N-H82]|uniref:Predicted protein n=1 Tax=Laccaria bicolor (strain S238N-H82 / ATCC MYA-4686) TaxID=486041 RepID=B0CZ18_LACBS|nr:uncharacterized protein LACBIDRAFT_293010 [Laccaria bicolor S238N-H82]EDR12984.1 predicted protein [Laccaria bicolor S238N-H82]|eukprot:XP_001877248.1 predicted protein [Laccaria bicolor S238N-H82]